MDREVLDRWCERGILILVLVMLVFLPLAFGGIAQYPAGSRLDFLWVNPFGVAQWLSLGVMALWLCRLWLNPKPRILWPPICWAVVAFTVYAIIRYLTADIEYVARQEVLQVLVYAFLFFAILNNLHRQESTQIISFTLIFLAMAIALYASYQFLTNSDRVWHLNSGAQHRGTGTYISPNHLGGFLEMLLPLGLAYVLAGRLKPLTKVLLAYASLALLVGIGATISRGSWLSTGLALVLFFVVLLFHRSYRLPALVLLLAVVGTGLFSIPRDYSLRVMVSQRVGDPGKYDRDGRFDLWRPAAQMLRENFWWGMGPAHFNYRFGAYRPEDIQLQPDRVHNDYLNTLVDWGVVGTALVASAWLLLGWGVCKSWRFVGGTPSDLGGRRGSNKFAFVLGASFGLLAILFHSAVDFNMHLPANALLAVTLMALLSSHLRFATERYWAGLGFWAKMAASLLLMAGLGYLGQQSWRRASEAGWLARAAQAPQFSPEQMAWLEKAFAAEPKNPETAYAIGEAYRVQSLLGGENYRELAGAAMEWFGRSMKLNPWDSYSCLRYGMCLDWVGRQTEAAPYFDRAEQLDPKNYFIVANIGLHFVEVGDYAAAKPWLERSLRLQHKDNSIAENYLQIANRRLLEAATNGIGQSLLFPR